MSRLHLDGVLDDGLDRAVSEHVGKASSEMATTAFKAWKADVRS